MASTSAPVYRVPRLRLISPLVDDNWGWLAAAEKKWDVVTGGYEQFYDYWRDSSANSRFRNTFPYELSLSKDSASPLPFQADTTLGDKILVTKSYNYTLHRVLDRRISDIGPNRGVVFTGQPGIGASMTRSHPMQQLISASVL